MRLCLAISFLAALSDTAAFVPRGTFRSTSPNVLWSSTVEKTEASREEVTSATSQERPSPPVASSSHAEPLSGSEIKARMEKQLERLREKDRTSPKLSKEDLKVLFEDDDIIVINKPSGVLTVSGKEGHNSLAQSVHENFGASVSADQMVVHRLGMDTSGLIIFAKTMDAVRGMNALFRTRRIERKYEALVCGSMEKDSGVIDLPIMRDYEFPPFMRISTDEHQAALSDLDPDEVGKKLLERPKDSLTKYEVVAREEMDGQPVTRVSLTSVSGRTHQLNVHLAAFGHPIVGDATYGMGGDAAPAGGLSESELPANPARASAEVQKALNAASKGKACIHAKSLKFRHPVSKEEISLSVDAPF